MSGTTVDVALGTSLLERNLDFVVVVVVVVVVGFIIVVDDAALFVVARSATSTSANASL